MLGRHLDDQLIELIKTVSAPLGEISDIVMSQAKSARILSYRPTVIGLEVAADVPAIPARDGPLPGRAMVYEGSSLVGEVMLWVEGGRLTGMEQAWYADHAPDRWPSPDHIRVE